MKKFLLAKLRVYEHESAPFLWIALIFFCLYFVTAIFRNYVDTTFFKRYGVGQMPLMLVINGLLTFLLFGVMNRIGKKWRDQNLLAGFLIFYALLVTGLYFLVKAEVSSAYPLLFQLLYLQDSVFLVYLWNIAGDLFDARQGKRVFQLIMGTQVLATTLGNFATQPLTRLIGYDLSLIIFAVMCFGVAVFLLRTSPRWLSPGDAKPAITAVPSKKLHELPAIIKQYPIFRYLFISSLIPNILLPILTYQFSLIANQTFATEQTLIAFLSYFRGLMTLTVFILVFSAGKFYAKLGLAGTSLIYPLNFTLLFTCLTFFFNIFVAAYGQFTTGIIQRVLNGPVNKILFNLLPRKIAPWSRVFIRGTVVKIGMMAGALLLWTLKPWLAAEYLAPLAAVLALYLAIETIIFVRNYYQGLKQVILEEVGDLDLLDATSAGDHYSTHLRVQTLDLDRRQDEVTQTSHLPGLSPDIALKLLADPNPMTRTEAAIFFIHHPDLRAVGPLLKLLDDQESARQAAIEALVSRGEEITCFLEAALLDSSLRRQRGILEVLRLAGMKKFDILPYLNQHVNDAYNNLIFIEVLSELTGSPAIDLLITHLREENHATLNIIFQALRVNFDDMRLMYNALYSSEASAAIEMVEASLGRDLGKYLIPLIDTIPPAGKIAHARQLLLLVQTNDLAGVLAHLVINPDPTTRMLAAYAIGAHAPGMIYYPLAEMLLTDSDPPTRAMADYALSCCLGRKAAMPDIIKRINDLKGFDLFEGLSLRELQAIAAIAGLLSYQPGEVILREGEDNSAIILLIKGRIRICRNYGASNEELKATISPGSYIGELSLFTQRPANATCIAAEPTEALVIRHHHFQEIMKIYPQIAINLCRYFASKLRDEAY
jgi:hypothetical protein